MADDGQAKIGNRSEKSLQAIFVFAAIVAFALSPAIKYADVASGVTAAGIGGLGIMLMMIMGKSEIGFLGGMMMTGALIWGAVIASDAMTVRALNQRRCLDIEIDMLADHPKRSNAADIFQALGCEPQPTAATSQRQLVKTPAAKERPALPVSPSTHSK